MIRYYREYIGEGQEEIAREEAESTLKKFYCDPAPIMADLDSGAIRSVRLPGGYIAAENDA
jgi:hypothetical protein